MERAVRIAVLAAATALLSLGTRVHAAVQQPVRVTPRPIPSGTAPLRVTPIPFTDDEPFVLTLPEKYASRKPFAIAIPKLGIEDIGISHPADPFTQNGVLQPLKEGLGHLFAYPGDRGKAMIYGHSSGYPWDVSSFTRIFRRINELEAGDRVYVTYGGKLRVYEVSYKQVIDADDVSPFADDGSSALILYTCWPPDSIRQRYLVHALPVETIALERQQHGS